MLTIKIAQEYFVVTAGTLLTVTSLPTGFLTDAMAQLGEFVSAEALAAKIRIESDTHVTSAAATDQLRAKRALLNRIGANYGLALLASGTHPRNDWSEQAINPEAQTAELVSARPTLARRANTCATEYVLGADTPDDVILLMDRLRPIAPQIIALGASSPFWRGQDTGVEAFRAMVTQQGPRTGLAPRFQNRADYDATLQKLRQIGFLDTHNEVWWWMRPDKASASSLVVRLADSLAEFDRIAFIAALLRAYADAALTKDAVYSSTNPVDRLIQDENVWEAIVEGLDASQLSPTHKKSRLLHQLIRTAMRTLAPHADKLDDLATLNTGLEILARPTEARLQIFGYQADLRSGLMEHSAMRELCSRIRQATALEASGPVATPLIYAH